MTSGERLGPYWLESLVGRGGMGQVWRARDTRHDDREVALKVLPRHLADDPEFRARFRNEAARAAGLASPRIIPIHSYGETDGQLYIEMPLATGTALDDVIAIGGLPPARAVKITTQIARALDAVHAHGPVHRDVKPANIPVDQHADDFAHLVVSSYSAGSVTVPYDSATRRRPSPLPTGSVSECVVAREARGSTAPTSTAVRS